MSMINTRISLNGVQIGVIKPDCGIQNTPVLVLLHGFTGSASSWERLMTDLIQQGMHVVALDMLGHGQSDMPNDSIRYSIEHCQEDIIAVLQALDIGPGQASLLGYSMGGRIALYCAFTGYFRALILESASPGLSTAAEQAQRRKSDEALAARIEHAGIEAFVNEWEQLPLFASQRNLPVELWRAQRAQRLSNHATGLANSLRGVGTGAQPSLHKRLSELKLPTLLITGTLDPKFGTIAQKMLQQIPQAQWETVPDAGHTVHLEQPERFVELISKFCASVL